MDEMSRKLIQQATSDLEVVVYCWMRRYRELCGSPIEVMLAQAFTLRHFTEHGFPPHLGIGEKPADLPHLIPQYVVPPYRVDFMLEGTGKTKGVAIECDGHDFHERTKEQAEKDRSRDRDLTLQGYQVLRFTGSEIYRDAWKCAGQILRALGKMEWENNQ